MSLSALGALTLAGCGASFQGDVYRDGPLAFRVGPVPEDWERVTLSGSRLAFRDAKDEATIGVNARCGKDANDVPLRALTRHLFLQFGDCEIESEQALQLDGRGALRTELTASLDGVPMHFVAVVMKKDGCVYDFVDVTPLPVTAASAASVAEFDRFVAGFATLGGSAR